MGLEEIKQSMEAHQADYRRVIALLGHARAQRLSFQSDEEGFEKELLVICKKIRNLESQMPKEQPKGESKENANQ